jgi:hypothetical protein
MKHNSIMTYEGVEVQLCSLTPAFNGDEWSASLWTYYPWGKNSRHQLNRRLDGLQS